jgi:hypothetical protein
MKLPAGTNVRRKHFLVRNAEPLGNFPLCGLVHRSFQSPLWRLRNFLESWRRRVVGPQTGAQRGLDLRHDLGRAVGLDRPIFHLGRFVMDPGSSVALTTH